MSEQKDWKEQLKCSRCKISLSQCEPKRWTDPLCKVGATEYEDHVVNISEIQSQVIPQVREAERKRNIKIAIEQKDPHNDCDICKNEDLQSQCMPRRIQQCVNMSLDDVVSEISNPTQEE